MVIGTKKWMPGEHPFACPLSMVTICELKSGDIIETDRLQWTNRRIDTPLAHHNEFQDLVFAWLETSAEFKAQQTRLAALIA